MSRAKLAVLLLATTFIGFGAGVCLLKAGSARPRFVTFDPPYPKTNAAGDGILAAYAGRVPCEIPQCNMMKLALVLYHDRATGHPTTYWLGYIGVGDGDNERTVREGRVKVRTGIAGYPAANVYELDANSGSDLRLYWQVNEDILLPLDNRRNPKIGNAAWGFMLSRDRTPYGPRTYQL